MSRLPNYNPLGVNYGCLSTTGGERENVGKSAKQKLSKTERRKSAVIKLQKES